MDTIYKCADFTIVAAAREDEHHGLSGLGVERSLRVVEINDYTVLHMPAESWWTSREAPWTKIAWVTRPHLDLFHN
jgi:hypothetical protein